MNFYIHWHALLAPRACLLPLATSLILCAPLTAQAGPICGVDVKNVVAKLINDTIANKPDNLSKLEDSLYIEYQYCAKDGLQVPGNDPFYVAAAQCSAKVTYLGSTYFEEMPCCGYDPQRRTFACPIKIKQGFGFGLAAIPGSREYVLHCVKNSAGVFVPVGNDSVHLADSSLVPTWQFAVVANANNNLSLLQPMNGTARIARSILSWNLPPTSCLYRPIWGNVVDYPIRLNQ